MIYTFSAGCPASGTISIEQIAEEMLVSASGASLQSLSLLPLNPNASVKPNGYAPHEIAEFRGYKHRNVGVSKDEFTFDHYASGDTFNFEIWPSAVIGLKTNSDWIQASNAGGGVIYVSVPDNPFSLSRHGIVEVMANGVTAFVFINQAGNPFAGVEM